MKKILATTLAFGLIALAGTAMADTFYERFDDNVWFNRNNTSHTWTFDLDNDTLQTSWLNSTAVDINSWDTIDSAEFRLAFYDDHDRWREYGNVINNDNNGATIWSGEVGYQWITANVSAQLFDHTLSVTVNRTSGDFGVDWTRLSGTYTEGNAPVPEPATMLLFGTGLIGLIGYSRKRAQKS